MEGVEQPGGGPGDVHFDVIAKGEWPSRLRVNLVRFAPGARTAWHRHANGQTLHVTDGVGFVQSRGGELIVMKPGDTVYTPPGEWHWHGATGDDFMCHLAMWEALAEGQEGPETEWAEHVGDEDRRSGGVGAPDQGQAVPVDEER